MNLIKNILGSSLGQKTTNDWDTALIPDGPIVQVDLDQGVIGRGYPIELGVFTLALAFAGERRDGIDQRAEEYDTGERAEGETTSLCEHGATMMPGGCEPHFAPT